MGMASGRSLRHKKWQEETDSPVCLGVLIPGEIGDADVSLDLLQLLQDDRYI